MERRGINERNSRTELGFDKEMKATSDRIFLGRINVTGFIELLIQSQDEEKVLKASKNQNRLPKSIEIESDERLTFQQEHSNLEDSNANHTSVHMFANGRIYIKLWGVQGTRKEDSLFHFYPALIFKMLFYYLYN